MAEPTTSTAVGWAIAAGALSAFFAGLGVSWAVVFWALCGTIMAAPVVTTVGRLRAIGMFPASVLLAAKAGTLWSGAMFSASPEMAGGLAAVSGIILHPMIGAMVKRLPDLISTRIGLPPEEPTK